MASTEHPPQPKQQPRPLTHRQTTRHDFQAGSTLRQRREAQKAYGVDLTKLWIGLAVSKGHDGTIEVGFASHDGTYSIDFAVTTLQDLNGAEAAGQTLSNGELTGVLADLVVDRISTYQTEHLYKFLGAGVSRKAADADPELCAKLWSELDIVPLVFGSGVDDPYVQGHDYPVDEEADSMARKCLHQFGPTLQPRLQVGYRNRVEVDCGGRAHLTSAHDYIPTVGKRTWDATIKYAESLKKSNVKIVFFNSTPQGGGVALMRHALIRFLALIGVDTQWYVPKPKPEVFRITKNNHNILQGVADPNLRLTQPQKETLDEWAKSNSDRFWTRDGGVLSPRSKGGADVIIVDDPQMPSLVKIAKAMDPDRPVIFRSHIQVRADLADEQGTPTSEVWDWVWGNVKDADLFISHPVREFVPNMVDFNKVGYLPATTDWLDGLNKQLSNWDNQYYMHEFETQCQSTRMNILDYPNRDYIVQIARFDPAKGIPDVLASYAELRRRYFKDVSREATPQLVVAGHGAIDDPDTTTIYNQTITQLETKYEDIKEDVVVMRLGPTDQILNVLVSNAKVALQLSTREGFEVKVSEALHKGIPIIATKAGGIPLQVEDGKSGFLVEPSDSSAVAKHLYQLFTNDKLYEEMSDYAAHHVSDEVSTVGNALSWLYLADQLAKGNKLVPNSAWINDMAREEAGLPYEDSEPRLPRHEKLNLK